MSDARYILFFDGECVMCNGIVKWMVEHDPDRNFHFASLQGETAAEMRAEREDFPEGLDTFVFYDDGEIRLRSRAAFWAARLMRAPWRWARFLRVVPRFISDAVYNFIAKRRIQWFGSTESCWFAPAEEQPRFLP